jgi:hypothetical protein
MAEVMMPKARDLWHDAQQSLSPEDITNLLPLDSNLSPQWFQDLYNMAVQIPDDSWSRRLTSDFSGRKIPLRDLADKILVWLNKFKEIGDHAVSFDPVVAILPWAGVRVLLQVGIGSFSLHFTKSVSNT